MINTHSKSSLLQPADVGEVHDYDWGGVVWLIAKRLGNSDQQSFGRVTVFGGQKIPNHRHVDSDEVLHLISGRFEQQVGEDVYTLEPGDTISIPAGAWHRAQALGDAEAVGVISFNSADHQTEYEEESHAGSE